LASSAEKILRNPNVFKNWQNDTTDVLEAAIRADQEAWKVSKFVKDPVEYKNICQLVRQHYMYLKQIFVSITSRDNFPSASTLNVTALLHEAQMLDQNLTTGIVDT
jgi:tRNA-dihydrouridine synthase